MNYLLDGLSLQSLEDKQKGLETRLNIGEEKIIRAKARGKEVGSWEDAWVEVLREYEATTRKIYEIKREKKDDDNRSTLAFRGFAPGEPGDDGFQFSFAGDDSELQHSF